MASPARSFSIALAAVAAATLFAATPGTALARGAHHAGRPAKAHNFTAHGVVVSHTSSTVTVLARQVRVGKQARQNQRITVQLPKQKRGHSVRVPANGSLIRTTGTTTGSGKAATYTARTLAEQHTDAHVYLGTIESIAGALVTIAKAPEPSDDPSEDGTGLFTVDTSTAAILVDGAAGDLAVGQSAAVLGTGDNDAIVATAVYAFTTAPTSQTGEVVDVTGNIVTLSGEDDASTAIDLSGVMVVLDGVSGATADQITLGSRVLVLGTIDGTGTFTPTLAFAFSPHEDDGGGDS